MERRCIHAIFPGLEFVRCAGHGQRPRYRYRATGLAPSPVQGAVALGPALSLLILTAIELQRLCGASPEISYWRTPTKIAGDKPLVTLPRASALPSALIAPL